MVFKLYLQLSPSDLGAKVRPDRRRTRPPTDERAPIDPRSTSSICLACGEPLSAALERTASLRCNDCRDADAPLCEDLVDPPEPLRLMRRLRLRPAA
jgi:hypothetical protein